MVAEADISREETAPVWLRLQQRTDPTADRPCLRPGLAWQELTTTQGEAYAIIQNPAAATYLRLPAEDFYLFQLMDGSRSVQDLVVAYMLRFRRFALQHVLRLVADLRQSEFLTDRPYDTFPRVRRLAAPPSLRGRLDRLLALYLNREFPVRGVDAAFEKLYRGGAWTLLTVPGLILLAAVVVAGVPLLLWDLQTAHISLTDGSALARYAALGYLSLLGIAIIHELGHAFAVKSYGRAIRRSGFCLFYGSPGLYVDTQDMWMAPRRARIVASWAGPYSGFILAGLAGLALTLLPSGGWAIFVRAFGITALIENAFQLNPFIQYDGYYILMDWLDVHNLRRRALTFIRFDLARKLRRRERFNREERIFAVFGLLAAAYTVLAVFLAVTFGWDHARSAIQSAVRVPNLQSLFLAALLLMILVPFVIGVGGRLFGLAAGAVRSLRRAGGAARQRWYHERATLLAQVPALAALGEEPVRALAPQLRESRPPAGAAVVRQGEAGDRFYLIAGGEAEVLVADESGSKQVAELGPMDYFGERALLSDAPRAATVRAKTPLRLLSLSGRDFRASIGPYIAADAALRAHLDGAAELDAFPLLEPLGPQQKEVLLRRLRPLQYEAGGTIVRQDEAGADFYLIRSGRVEVSRRDEAGRETLRQTLGRGDFFGEIALLLDSPRVATVTALEETLLWALSRQDFTELLSGYFNLDERLAPVVRERLSEDYLLPIGDGARLPSAGDAAPAFALESAEGRRVALGEYTGRPLLLWFSAGIGGCAGALRDAAPLLAERRAALLEIVPSGSGAAAGAPFETLLDPERSVYRAYGMYAASAASLVGADHGADGWTGAAWKAAMRRLAPDEDGRGLAALQEGIVAIDSAGAIVRIVRPVDGAALPAVALLEGLDGAPDAWEGATP